MPVEIDATEVVARATFQGTAEWEAARLELASYLADETRRTTNAIAFTAEDGFTDEKVSEKGTTRWMVGLQSLRNSAKALGFSISGVWNPDKKWLGVKFGGPYVELSEAEKKARADKRAANKLAREAAAAALEPEPEPEPEPVKPARKR